jgi:hypothetical protein
MTPMLGSYLAGRPGRRGDSGLDVGHVARRFPGVPRRHARLIGRWLLRRVPRVDRWQPKSSSLGAAWACLPKTSIFPDAGEGVLPGSSMVHGQV